MNPFELVLVDKMKSDDVMVLYCERMIHRRKNDSQRGNRVELSQEC